MRHLPWDLDLSRYSRDKSYRDKFYEEYKTDLVRKSFRTLIASLTMLRDLKSGITVYLLEDNVDKALAMLTKLFAEAETTAKVTLESRGNRLANVLARKDALQHLKDLKDNLQSHSAED